MFTKFELPQYLYNYSFLCRNAIRSIIKVGMFKAESVEGFPIYL